MSSYLKTSEYADFGLASVQEEKINNACIVVDAYLSRKEGLTYAVDGSGYPIYMARSLPEATFRLTENLVAGTNVTAKITSGPLLQVGSALVLDRQTPGDTETVFVSQVVDLNTVVLANVAIDHATNTVLESGLVIEHTLNVPKSRHYVTLPTGPIRRIVSTMGRVSYGRRGSNVGSFETEGLLPSMSQFGGAPLWTRIDVAASDIDFDKNQVWTPMGMMMSSYTEVRVAYLAGYPVNSVPLAIKRATASIAKAINDSPASASVSMFRAGEVQMERFVASVLDEELRSMLSPYKANIYG